jgi:hypothetical protein
MCRASLSSGNLHALMYNDGQYESYQNFASHPTLPWQLGKTKKEYESVQLHGAIYSL